MKRRGAIILGITGSAFVVALMVGGLGGFRINLTPSYPLGLWRIETLDLPVANGDLVFICPPVTPAFAAAYERGYIRRGLCPGWFSPLIKTVVAMEGQPVDIGRHVLVDGHPLTHSKLRRADAEGRALDAWSGGVVPDGFVYLHSNFVGSYDSRYFGPIPAAGLLGRAVPIYTVEP